MIKKSQYCKKATNIPEQIGLLEQRGVIVDDKTKAAEVLGDIGYYRLGFYLFPFEKTYPYLDKRRKHDVQQGTKLESIVALYYFDFDLRNILNRYVSRIEVAVRTTLIYELSNKYIANPTWFVDSNVVTKKFISDFDAKAYSFIRTKAVIVRHHNKYNGKYAPAWKTCEFMTLGNIANLYDGLILGKDKQIICKKFGEPATATFSSYLAALKDVRNACAHGNMLFSLSLTTGIRQGMACQSFVGNSNQKFIGALKVIDFLLGKISENRRLEMWNNIYDVVKILYNKVPTIRPLIESETGIVLKS